MKPIVVVAGIMDTKGKELLYIRDRVRVMGCDTLMIELSLGKHVEMYRVDMHINQPEFADLFYLALHSILDGRYEKGSLANGKIVEKLF